MNMFEEIEAELGIDANDPKRRLASELVKEDRDLIEALVSLRLRKGLTQTAIADEFGRHRSAVCNFERLGADPHLSTIRRYATAVGARIRHILEDVDDPGVQHTSARGWVQVLTDRFELSDSNVRVYSHDYVPRLSVHTRIGDVEIVEEIPRKSEGRHRRVGNDLLVGMHRE